MSARFVPPSELGRMIEEREEAAGELGLDPHG
jgi:hypothetical protein